MQQLLHDYQCFEKDIQAAMQNDEYHCSGKDLGRVSHSSLVYQSSKTTKQSHRCPSNQVRRTCKSSIVADVIQHNDSDSNSDCDTDTKMPILVGGNRNDASSDDDTSDGFYVDSANEQKQGDHTNNGNISVGDSDDESNNTIPGLQERTHDNSSSDGDSEYNRNHACGHNPKGQYQLVPNSIDTNPIVSEWTNDNTNRDEYDGDHDDNNMPRLATRYLIAPLRLRGGNRTPLVETVTEEDTKKAPTEQEQPHTSTKRAPIPITASTILPPQKPEYDPMADEPPPATITPPYVPFHKKNEHWGDQCEPAVTCEEPEFIKIYSQNNNGISDSTGLKYDDTFKHMKEADADIFSVNKTHAGKMYVKNNKVLETSQRRIFQSTDGQYCSIVSSSSLAPITSYTKPGGNMMGITDPLIGCIGRRIEDKYGEWRGFVLLREDNREILVLTAHNVPQDTPAGDNSLHAQNTSLYLLDGEVDPNPRKLFIRDLLSLITIVIKENQDIILMGDFNEVVGNNPK